MAPCLALCATRAQALSRLTRDCVVFCALSPQSDILSEDKLPNDELLKEHFRKEGRVTPQACMYLLNTVREILKKEVRANVCVCACAFARFFVLLFVRMCVSVSVSVCVSVSWC